MELTRLEPTVRDLDSALLDPRRLGVLARTGLLDSPPEEPFDRLTRLVAKLLDVPVALIALVDRDRQFHKSQVGLTGTPVAKEMPLTHSFCKHMVVSEQPFIVEDVTRDPVLHKAPSVRELGIRAYAGIPLILDDGGVIGGLCAIDHKPREWSEGDFQVLQDLSGLVRSEIEHRLLLRDVKQVMEIGRSLEAPLTRLLAHLETASRLMDGDDPERAASFLLRSTDVVHRLQGIREDLSAHSDVSGGMPGANTAHAHLDRRLLRAVNQAQEATRTQNIELEVSGLPLRAECDGLSFEQAVYDVLVQVIQFCSGTDRVEVHAGREGADAVIRIQEHSRGIPVADLVRLVTRLCSGINCSGPGPASANGTGMQMTRDGVVIEREGVWASSSPGKGTIFILRVGLHNPEPGSS